MKTIVNIFKYTILIVASATVMGWVLINMDDQHQKLENKYQQECIENQRGL